MRYTLDISAVHDVNGEYLAELTCTSGERRFTAQADIRKDDQVSDFANDAATDLGLSEDDAGDIARMVTEKAKATATVKIPSTPVIPLDSIPVPMFPDGIFTGAIAARIDAEAEFTETPPELAATFAIGALVTAVQGKFRVMIREGYYEPLCLWALTALPSGSRKTAVRTAMIRPLNHWEQRRRAELLPLIEKAQSERKTVQCRIEYLRKQARKGGADLEAKKKEIADLEAGLPPVPVLPQLYADDITVERAGMIMAEQDERLSIISDEGGFFDNLNGRYSTMAAFDLYLQGHSESYVRVDRSGRPAICLQHPSMSMAISPQPGVLRRLMSNTLFREKGLLARCLLMVPPSNIGQRTGGGRTVPKEVEDHYETVIDHLLSIEKRVVGGKAIPYLLTFSPDANAVLVRFWEELESLMAEGGKLAHVQDWGSKLSAAMARFAAIVHCAEHYSSLTLETEVQAETVERAVIFGRYLIDHALAAFGLMGVGTSRQTALDIWRQIRLAKKAEFTLSDAWRGLRNRYDADGVQPGFDLLEDHGYIIELHQADEGAPRKRKGRPPSRRFRVNPSLAKTFCH